MFRINFPNYLFFKPILPLFITLFFFLACPKPSIETKISLAPIFKSNLVLQRDKPIPIWGKAQAGETIKVSFAQQIKTTVVDAEGYFKVFLDPQALCSEGKNLIVEYEEKSRIKKINPKIVLQNVLVGDVWLCAGQSNMEFGLSGVENRLEELKDVKYSLIRLCMIGKNSSGLPKSDIPLIWSECNRESVSFGGWFGFSAVAFYFGRKLHKELGIPIGLIQAAYGGSKIGPFIPAEEAKDIPLFLKEYTEVKEVNQKFLEELKKNKNAKHPYDGIAEPRDLKLGTAYNIMINPIVPFALRGVIWYQGESNVGEGMYYALALKLLIQAWRKVFQQDDLPFYYVQLPPWDYGHENSLPAIWEAQEAVLQIPNTGMAVIIDTADLKDIHPRNKKPVGERLALLALKRTYGRLETIDSGPVFRSMKIDGRRAIISFENVGQGLVSIDGKPLRWFKIAGSNLVFVDTKARIEGETVVVENEKVANPVAVRFAWSSLAQPNLANKDGLPARPFRTDK